MHVRRSKTTPRQRPKSPGTTPFRQKAAGVGRRARDAWARRRQGKTRQKKKQNKSIKRGEKTSRISGETRDGRAFVLSRPSNCSARPLAESMSAEGAVASSPTGRRVRQRAAGVNRDERASGVPEDGGRCRVPSCHPAAHTRRAVPRPSP